MRSHRALLLLPTLLAACSQDAPVQYRVPDLRVLAIRGIVEGTANTADPDPGGQFVDPLDPAGPPLVLASETLNLTALVANPLARPGVTVGWFTCAPPIPGSPCDPTQLRDLDAFETAQGVFPLGTGETLSLDFDSAPAALRARIDLAMELIATPGYAYPCTRYAELPVLAIVRASGVAEATLKRVRLRPTRLLAAPAPADRVPDFYLVNHNPGIAEASPGVPALQENPSDPEACKGGTLLPASLPAVEVTVCAPTTPIPPEPYKQCKEGVASDVAEEPELQWYVSAGEIAGTNFDGNAEGTHIDFTPAPGTFRLWVIVRDGNGGTDWAFRDLSSP
jgi:hypothetical protein